ncbi:ABC transporter substrate-binding protein [Marinomonas sp. 2405UD68-3]|uniref:ABC transporter substrate-binding protein n=1 Tax=Marinomonas sp. 2405UD68-3 TaxID=3391835 RepID=UPI0039C8EAD3
MRLSSKCHLVNLSLFFTVFLGVLQAEEIKIYNWEAFLSPTVITQFTKETGHTVSQTFFDNDHQIGSLFANGKSKLFDLLMIQSSRSDSFGARGYLKPIAPLKLKNLELIDSIWLESCGTFSLPYSWGTAGLAYRSSLVDKPIQSWNDFFYPNDVFKNRIIAQTDATTLTETALIHLRKDPNSENVTELKKAYNVLLDQKPYILEYKYGITYANEHKTNSQMAMTLAFSGDIEEIITKTQQNDWVYTIPKEGTMLWVDCLSLPADKEIKQATIDFLNFINQPEIAALNSVEAHITTVNKDALKHLPRDILDNIELYPTQAIIDISHPYRTLKPASYKIRQKMMNALTLDQ